jgi:hypothetical protein
MLELVISSRETLDLIMDESLDPGRDRCWKTKLYDKRKMKIVTEILQYHPKSPRVSAPAKGALAVVTSSRNARKAFQLL